MLAVAAISSGCRPAMQPPRSTYPVTVTVRFHGREVAGATVMLAPRGEGYASQGLTNERGQATLSTFRPGDGAVPGEYGVAVLKYDTQIDPTLSMPDPADKQAYQEACEQLLAAGRNIYVHKPRLPERYADPGSSGLAATVTATDRNLVTLELDP